ncbi:ribonuclease H-like domain-containing protein [Suillus clintonianus]|uniref:ribonuclease H-like domain-containing protein n=1 Tax=Suillus clintonianus TaxID=1904413 RepID=UPI001B878BF7|nr:ribonuclease H-like domain-containing protein [Suillus clintonianus]KAG2155701.1 ribonuclease H-like domain-containing protein [Suillus clintonianus]
MPKAQKTAYYAVRKGRTPGVYPTWSLQVKNFHGAIYKKLNTETEALAFIAGESSLKPPSEPSSSKVSPTTMSSVASTFRPMAVVNVKEDEPGYDVVYSDGACKGNGQVGSVAGVGVWWGWNDSRREISSERRHMTTHHYFRNIAERCPGDQTNNRAELIASCAIVRALETAPFSQQPLMIKTDSKYAIQCFESWLPKWSANGFRTSTGQPVKNVELITYLAALLYARERAGPKVVFKHVRGHVGIEGNEGADRLANDGALKPQLPERDWLRLTRDLEKKPITSRTIPAPVKLNVNASVPRRAATSASGSSSSTRPPQPPITMRVSYPPTSKPESLSKAELDAYASCLLDADQLTNLETDDLESDF